MDGTDEFMDDGFLPAADANPAKNNIISWSNDVIQLRVLKQKNRNEQLSSAARLLNNCFLSVVNHDVAELLAAHGYDYFKRNTYISFSVDLDQTGFMRTYREKKKHISREDIAEAAEELQNNMVIRLVDESERRFSTNLYERVSYDKLTNVCDFRMSVDWIPLFAPGLKEKDDQHYIELMQTFNFSSGYTEKLYVYINGEIQNKAYVASKGLVCPIIRLKALFDIAKGTVNYENQKFINKYLSKSIMEVLQKSDLRFEHSFEKVGRSVKNVVFTNISRADEHIFDCMRKQAPPVIDAEASQVRDVDDLREQFLASCREEGFSGEEADSLYHAMEGRPGYLEKLGSIRSAYRTLEHMGVSNAIRKIDFFLKSAADLPY